MESKYIPLCPDCVHRYKYSKLRPILSMVVTTLLIFIPFMVIKELILESDLSAGTKEAFMEVFSQITPPLILFSITMVLSILLWSSREGAFRQNPIIRKMRKLFWSPDENYEKATKCVNDGREAFCRCALCFKPFCKDCFTKTTPEGLLCEECMRILLKRYKILALVSAILMVIHIYILLSFLPLMISLLPLDFSGDSFFEVAVIYILNAGLLLVLIPPVVFLDILISFIKNRPTDATIIMVEIDMHLIPILSRIEEFNSEMEPTE